MEISKESLEWICEQLEYFETQSKYIEDEAYNCRKEIQRWIENNDTTPKVSSSEVKE